ncbi:MAG: GDP-mannose 4,6-dehydratase [Micavibrio sp.]|nr:GDP-mannose 4,6-dehydratase [Micavibrio sp.]
MVRKTALITGITGQDGAYLAAHLVGLGYDIHGLVRWDSYVSPADGLSRLDLLGLVDENITLHYGDICDANNINHLIKEIRPDEIYNLAALSHVKVSFETPASALEINTHGTLNVLEAVRVTGQERTARIYQASSSEMFGSIPAPQSERAPMEPCSPYGAAKLAAYHLARIYRQSYGLWVCNGILFNHESPLRGEGFVTHKITRAVAELDAGVLDKPLILGNLDSVRDWGDARDYVRGMHMMMQTEAPDDFVLASGRSYSVRDFAGLSFDQIGVKIIWQGKGKDEVGLNAATGRVLIKVDLELFRPLELNFLLGDASKAEKHLGWKPEISLEQMIKDMIDADRLLIKEQPICKNQKAG